MQTQCPNCGGYNTHHKRTTCVLPTGKEVPLSTLAWAVIAVIACPVLAYTGITQSNNVGVAAVIILVTLLALFGLIAAIRTLLKAPKYDTYDCWNPACRYTFRIPEVIALPAVSPPPPVQKSRQAIIGGCIGGGLIGLLVGFFGGHSLHYSVVSGGLVGLLIGGMGGGLMLFFALRRGVD